MNYLNVVLSPGLYLVATPIGTARDITLRALDTLASADVLVAEDTRSLKKLMAIHGVPLGDRPVWSHHDHSGAGSTARVVNAVAQGLCVAYASEAGTPMISDPGFDLVRGVAASGGAVTTAPGPSAAIAALTLARQPTDRFLFLGFLPSKTAARRAVLTTFARTPTTLVAYESPRRVQGTLADCVTVLGEERSATLCRELTKRFEEVVSMPLGQLSASLADRNLKGECVLVIGPPQRETVSEDRIAEALRTALSAHRVKDAAALVAGQFGVPRKTVYAMALAMGPRPKDDDDGEI